MVSLLHLPPELLLAICKLLCPHCTPGIIDRSPSRKALSALSCTCKELNQWAIPALYHAPACNTKSLQRLITTLSRRPDLAENVVNLWYYGVPLCRHYRDQRGNENAPHGYLTDLKVTDGQAACFQKLMKKFPAAANLSKAWYSRYLRSTDGGTAGLFEASPIGALTALLVTQAPKLVELRLEAHTRLKLAFSEPGSLPCLTKLSLIQHGRVREDFEGRVLLDCEWFVQIFAAAPALKILEMVRCPLIGLNGEIPCHDLSKLVITNCKTPSRALETLLHAFPRLESFSFHTNYFEWAALKPRQLGRLVDRYSKKLRYLTIRDASPAAGHFLNRDSSKLKDLRGMKFLEALNVDYFQVWAKDAGGLSNQERLGTLLPTSLRIIKIDTFLNTELASMFERELKIWRESKKSGKREPLTPAAHKWDEPHTGFISSGIIKWQIAEPRWING